MSAVVDTVQGALQAQDVVAVAGVVASTGGSKFQVPGAPRPPSGDITKSMIWIYGEPKVGKTTFMSNWPGLWACATEKGHDWVSMREPTPITSWFEWLEFCAFIEQTKPTHFSDGKPIRSLGIDTIDNLFKFCFDQICRDLNVQDPGEIPHGGGWGRLDKEWTRVMSKVRAWPYGLVCVSHSKTREFKTRGIKTDRNEPNIGAAGMRWCVGAADIILYAHAEQKAETNSEGKVTGAIIESRSLLCQPQSYALAGGRMTRLLGIPEKIPLDFKEFIKFFPDTKLED